MGSYFKILFVFIGTFFFNQAKSDHVLGGEIGWECIGVDTFKITVSVYRDCNGTQLSSTPVYMNSNCGSKTLTTNRGPGRDITPVCDDQCTICRYYRCSFQLGIEVYELTSTVILTDWRKKGCCEVTLNWSQCCRNGSITTGASNQKFYIEAKLNICQDPCNNSPTFINPPLSIICLGRDVVVNQGVRDTDIDTATGAFLDSFVYSFTAPMQRAGLKTTWSSGYAYDKPLYYLGFPKTGLGFPRGIHLDSFSGELMFRPMKVEQTTMAIKVEQYRNGKLLGVIIREMPIIVIKCPDNNPPVIGGINCQTTKNLSITACVGDSVTFDVCATDKDKNDTVTIIAKEMPLGARFKILSHFTNLPTGRVTWVIDSAAIFQPSNTFVFRAKDKGCPITGISDRTFKVYIKNKSFADIEINHSYVDSTCGSVQLDYEILDSQKIESKYWYINDTLVNESDTFNYTFSSTDTQFVRLIAKRDGCFYSFYDTIIPFGFKPIKIKPLVDYTFCQGELVIDTILASGGYGKFNYDWKYTSDNTVHSQGFSPFIDFKADYVSFNSQLIITVSDSLGCTQKQWQKLHIKPTNYNIDLLADITYCNSDSFIIKLPDDRDIKGKWYYDKIELPFLFNSNHYLPGIHTLAYKKEKDSNCITDILKIGFSPNPVLKTDSVVNICLNHIDYPLKSNYAGTIWSGKNVKAKSFFYSPDKVKDSFLLKAIYTNPVGCSDSAFTLVKVGADTANFYVKSNWNICYNDGDTEMKFKNLLSGGFYPGRQYFFDSLGTKFIKRNALKYGVQKAIFTGVSTNYCQSSRTLSITLNTKPVLDISKLYTTICEGADSIELIANPIPEKWTGNTAYYSNGKYFLDASKYGSGDTATVYAEYTVNDCATIDSIHLPILDSVVSNQKFPAFLCTGDTLKIKRLNNYGYWMENISKKSFSNKSPFIASESGSTYYEFVYSILEAYNNKLCLFVEPTRVKNLAKPKLPFKIDVNSGDAPLKVSFTSNFTNAYNYTWYFGTGDSAVNTLNPVYTYNDTGVYSIKVIASDLYGYCFHENIKENAINVTKSIGINRLNSGAIIVYPNPSQNSFTLQWQGLENSIAEMIVYNATGQEIYSQENPENNAVFGHNFSSGMYFVHLKFENGAGAVIKLVKGE